MTGFPSWFVLQNPPAVEITVDEWKMLGEDRVEILKSVQKNINDVINLHYDRSAVKSPELMNDYMKGHLFLRLAGAHSEKLKSWIIEAEGDLFAALFRNSSNEDQIKIVKNLFGIDNFLILSRLKSELMREDDLDDYKEIFYKYNKPEDIWCVRFSQVPWLVSKRKGFLFRSWLIQEKRYFTTSIKSIFERKLRIQIEQLSGKVGIDETIDAAIKGLENELKDIIQIQVKQGEFRIDSDKLAGKSLPEEVDAFPPCIRYLVSDLEVNGYLSHIHRLQLGWFLKKIGVSVDDQMRYWYEKSVDNIGISYEEFRKRIGYQIRHIYGLEGGKVDYEMPSCKKCQSDYFCFFTHLQPEAQESLINQWYFLGSEKLTRVMIISLKNEALSACNELFRSTYGFDARVYHPLKWVREVINTGALQRFKRKIEALKPKIEGGDKQ